ncbi:MAG TPA: aminotransferase class V-fold PLP-dependent enzyme [Vicinamibacterales bacterium]|nr:aminotransferase class V-fold PLP-dependent enzyme [Vicinamibacterales bacterium]
MSVPRRGFLARTGLVLAASASAACRLSETHPVPVRSPAGEWEGIRGEFEASSELTDLSALLIASHPRIVRDAIERYRKEIDRQPTLFLQRHNRRLQADARKAAARYLAAHPDDIALTDSTTMGLALLYSGLRLGRGDEVLTTTADYYATHESLRAAAARTGARIRKIHLYDHGDDVSAGELVDRIVREIGRDTRAVALTWVHSSTGLKLPVRAVSDAIVGVNRTRPESRRVLLCVDGVHGFGVEDESVESLGADFLAAGCHKWLFGPRGTGILWGRREAWAAVRPTIPSFVDGSAWEAWMEGEEPPGPSTASRITPGGFKPFEHVWAVREAFEFHLNIGKSKIAQRTHALARQLKEGLSQMGHVRLITPMSSGLSSGIVCFDVEGLTPPTAVERLLQHGIVATFTPYAQAHVRLTPCIRNTEEEIETALRAVAGLA